MVPPFVDVSHFAGSMLPLSKSSQRRPGHGAAPPAPPSIVGESPPRPPAAWPAVPPFPPAVPAEPADPAAAKQRLDAASLGGSHVFSTTPASLARVYVVADEIPSGPPTVAPVAAGEALRRAFEEELRLADADRPSLQASLDRIATSGVLPLFRRLSYPRDFEVLPALHAAIERDLGT